MAASIEFASTPNLHSYPWVINAGSISEIPSFQTMWSDLNRLVNRETLPHAEVWPPVPYTIQFTPSDCNTTSGPMNCTEACRNETFLFTPTNLRICSLLAAASVLVRNDNYSFDPTGDSARRVAQDWYVPDLETFDGEKVLGNITECISQSCVAASGVGTCSDAVSRVRYVPINATNLSPVVEILSHYCNGLNSITNADMAGPGVVLSYLFQTSLSLLFYVLVNFFKLWPRRIYAWLGCFSASLQNKGRRLQSSLTSSRFTAAAISSLVEFQEVQLYFIGSIQVASLISFDPDNPNTGSSNSNSFGSALLGSAIVSALGINGVYTVLLCQVCLQRSDMHWWYTFVLTSVVFVMAQVIVARDDMLMPSIEALWDKFSRDASVPACADNPSPMTFCGPPRGSVAAWSSGAEGRHVFVSVGTLAYVGLLIDQLSHALHDRSLPQTCKLGSAPEPRLVVHAQSAWPWIRELYWFSIQALLFVCTLLYYAVLLRASPRAGIGDTSQWSFGQLIAVMVWAPTIIKYIYFNLFGMEEGFEERVSKEYTILGRKRINHASDGRVEQRDG
ncbi:hypothetical protein S40288_10077 [Stachybotrys chartarum IBT 40288]|nr:hypothetical protein S40288_10077 [Stachybotrys chartarum IBT 40288]